MKEERKRGLGVAKLEDLVMGNSTYKHQKLQDIEKARVA